MVGSRGEEFLYFEQGFSSKESVENVVRHTPPHSNVVGIILTDDARRFGAESPS